MALLALVLLLREFGFVIPKAGHPADAIALSTRTAQRGPAVTQRASAIAVSSEGLTCPEIATFG